MKGKGKGKEQSDSKDCPLQFPDFTPVDHTRFCPRYTTVLQKSEDDSVGVEDVDSLQLEIESLLASVSKRTDQLQEEMQILQTWQDKREKKPQGKQEPEHNGKRCRPPDGKPMKKYKDGGGKAHPVTAVGRPRSKNVQQARMQEYEFTDSPIEPSRAPKNDSPNRFWTTLEPYCAEITQDDLKVLEDLIKAHDDDAEYQKIPPLGKHYSYKWAREDFLEEQKEGSKPNERRRGLSNNSSLNSAEADKLLKKIEKEYDSDDASPLGALTQRLVTCLIEENLMTSHEDTIMDHGKDGADGNTSPPPTRTNFIKSLNMGNTVQLEKKIRKELEENGILEADDMESENPDDEILAELKKLMVELKSISAHNLTQLKKLHRLAKDEMSRQDVKKKLASHDQELMEISRKINAARQKKKSPTKKERDHAWKLLKERENISKQLDSIGYKCS